MRRWAWLDATVSGTMFGEKITQDHCFNVLGLLMSYSMGYKELCSPWVTMGDGHTIWPSSLCFHFILVITTEFQKQAKLIGTTSLVYYTNVILDFLYISLQLMST